ncbi:hypothetical protein AAVH_10790 [Aphelenchoides avenae]|nr:hypothetical protein AAVH_10790 [Aphelenchus avenae]
MYERRVVNCSEDDKVSLLSEYLIGEARRAYKSVMSANADLTFRQLCRELKGTMIDSSRTGKLQKMKRFIALIESQAAEAYGDADEQTLDQVKTKVLISNLRERELVMHVETDLRKLKDDELQLHVVKSMAITYERTDVSANKWRSQGKKPYRVDSSGGNPQSTGQPQQSDGKSEASNVLRVWTTGPHSYELPEEVKALFDLGSQVNIISRSFLRESLRKGIIPCSKLKPGIFANPPGVNIKDASGTPMKFFGLGHCMVQIDASDTAEEHKFLVQEYTNCDVVLASGANALVSFSKNGVAKLGLAQRKD